MAPWYGEEVLRVADEAWAAIRRPEIDVRSFIWGSNAAFMGYLACGRREQLKQVVLAVKNQAEHTHQVHLQLWSKALEIGINLLDGRVEDAVLMSQQLEDSGKENRLEEFTKVLLLAAGIRPHIYLGNTTDYLEGLLKDPSLNHLSPFFLAHLDRHHEAAEWLERMLRSRQQITTFDDEASVAEDILYLESATIVGHSKTADLMLRRFSTNTLATTGGFYTTAIARHLGGAAALLGRYDEARKYYQEAIRVCTEMRFRPEMALTRLQLTELLLEHYPNEKKEAVEHLDFCIKEFREMKMQPSLERALRHKEILKA